VFSKYVNLTGLFRELFKNDKPVSEALYRLKTRHNYQICRQTEGS